MANIKSAKKRIGVINRKTVYNRRVKSSLKGIIKNFYSALAAENFDLAKEKLALAMKELCEDDNKRLKMGETGQKRVEKYYTHEISMKQYVDMYEEVLKNWR